MATESAETGKPPTHGVRQAPHLRRPVYWMHPTTTPTLTVEAAPGASAEAIASEVEACAARFAAAGEDASIDLRFLKAMPGEREALASLLGRGEVSAVVNALGRTEIHETAIPCVWWVRHHNSEGEIVGELIEITDVPEMIAGDRMAVARGLDAFRAARYVQARGAQIDPPYPNAR